jgi:hypothetical protein
MVWTGSIQLIQLQCLLTSLSLKSVIYVCPRIGLHIRPFRLVLDKTKGTPPHPCATLALKRHIPEPLLHPSQRRLHPTGFLFVWYFVYRLCGLIRTITVKIFPVSYGLQQLTYIKDDGGGGILRLPPREVLVGDANAHFKDEGNNAKSWGEKERSRFREH